MIFKMICDFKELALLLDVLGKKYITMFYNNALYIYTKNKKNTQNKIQKELESIIKSSFYLVKLDEYNLKYEPTSVVEWCKEKFIEYDTICFEAEKQKELQVMQKFIQDFDFKVSELIKNKKSNN